MVSFLFLNSQWHTFPFVHFYSYVGLSQVNRVTVKADDKSSYWLQKFQIVKTFTIILSSMNPNQTLVSKQEAQQAQILSFPQLVYADTQKCFYCLSNRNSLWNVNKTRHILRMHFLFLFCACGRLWTFWKVWAIQRLQPHKGEKSFLFTQAAKMLIRLLHTLIKLASMLKSRGSMPVLITDAPCFGDSSNTNGKLSGTAEKRREKNNCTIGTCLKEVLLVLLLMQTLRNCKFLQTLKHYWTQKQKYDILQLDNSYMWWLQKVPNMEGSKQAKLPYLDGAPL